MKIANIIAYILVIVGALNWGLFGFFEFNLVSTIFAGARTAGAVITYALIALAALCIVFTGTAVRNCQHRPMFQPSKPCGY